MLQDRIKQFPIQFATEWYFCEACIILNIILKSFKFWINGDNYGMIIRIFPSSLNRSINIIMDHCYNGNSTTVNQKVDFHISFTRLRSFLMVTFLDLKCIYLPNPSTTHAGFDTRTIFKQCLTSLNSEFSFSKTSCQTKVRVQSVPLFTQTWREIRQIYTFPWVLVLHGMQTALPRIWTRLSMSISYDDNCYITSPSV